MKDRCKCGACSALDHDACPKCGGQVDVHACEKCAASVMIWDDRCYACQTLNPRFKAKPQHGGKRPNAGRKPGNPRQSLTIRLNEPAIAKLHELRETTGTSAGRLIEGMIINYTKP